jgi:hypothetical protein
MKLSKWWLLVLPAVLVAVFATGALADHGGDHKGDRHGDKQLLQARLVGSQLSDPAIHGVTRGGVPWDGGGQAALGRHGRFEARIRGLVVSGTDNADGVTSIQISLFCAPDSDATPAFTTGSVPLSTHGNARIRQHVTVPARCFAPVLVVHPNSNLTRYIAATGFTH